MKTERLAPFAILFLLGLTAACSDPETDTPELGQINSVVWPR